MNKLDYKYPRIFKILTAVLIAGVFMLRYSGIFYELPDLAYSDEAVLMDPLARYVEEGRIEFREMKNHIELFYGPLYSNILLAAGIPFHAFLKTAYHYHEVPVWVFYFLARFLNLLLACLSVWLVYLVGKRYGSPWVGLMAALFLAFNTPHAEATMYAKSDMLSSALVLCVMLFIGRLLDFPKRKNYILTGLFLGLAVSAKLLAFVAVGPVVAATFLVHIRRNNGLKPWIILKSWALDKNMHWLCFFVFVGGALGAWQVLLGIPDLFRAIYDVFLAPDAYYMTSSYVTRDAVINLKYFVGLWGAYSQTLGSGVLVGLTLAGLMAILVSADKKKIVLFVFCLSAVILLRQTTRNSNHFVGVIPVMMIIAAFGLFWIVTKGLFFLKKTQTDLIVVVLGICVVIMIPSSSSTRTYRNWLLGKNAEYSKEDILAWIYGHIAPGSKISMERGFGSYGLFINQDLYDISFNARDLGNLKSNLPDYIFVNTSSQTREKDVEFYSFIKDHALLKKFPSPSRFVYPLEIYSVNRGSDIGENPFEIHLNKFNLKDGDFARMEAKVLLQKDQGYRLITDMWDDFPLNGYEDHLIQKVWVEGRAVWSNDIGKDTQSGWIHNEYEFKPVTDQVHLAAGIEASSKVYSAWADSSLTKIKIALEDESGNRFNPVWSFAGRNGSLKQFSNWEIKTLNRDEKNTQTIRCADFEDDIEKYWAFRLARYETADEKWKETMWQWADISDDSGAMVSKVSKDLTGSDHAVKLKIPHGGGEFVNVLSAGQALSGQQKEGFEDFAFDYRIDHGTIETADFEIRIHVIAKSLGGKVYKDQIWPVFDSRDAEDAAVDAGWRTYRHNLKDDLNHVFVPWEKIAFVRLMIEVVNYGPGDAIAEIDNVRGGQN